MSQLGVTAVTGTTLSTFTNPAGCRGTACRTRLRVEASTEEYGKPYPYIQAGGFESVVQGGRSAPRVYLSSYVINKVLCFTGAFEELLT